MVNPAVRFRIPRSVIHRYQGCFIVAFETCYHLEEIVNPSAAHKHTVFEPWDHGSVGRVEESYFTSRRSARLSHEMELALAACYSSHIRTCLPFEQAVAHVVCVDE